mmetsp:Transcript_9359/g.22157  ORF Transcript_9359/g.22157 Transcript_9359/m.22157 type:complete len:209 (+) Transcript_9359:8185-8811(+)|eukprot:1822009-Rhodomonas_salina.1
MPMPFGAEHSRVLSETHVVVSQAVPTCWPSQLSYATAARQTRSCETRNGHSALPGRWVGTAPRFRHSLAPAGSVKPAGPRKDPRIVISEPSVETAPGVTCVTDGTGGKTPSKVKAPESVPAERATVTVTRRSTLKPTGALQSTLEDDTHSELMQAVSPIRAVGLVSQLPKSFPSMVTVAPSLYTGTLASFTDVTDGRSKLTVPPLAMN